MKKSKNKSKKQRFNTAGETDAVAREISGGIKLQHMTKVSPMNDNQQKFIDMYDSGVPVMVVTGFAGTAKTFLSVYKSLEDVLTDEFDKLLIIRSAVQTRDQGFLPGDQNEKDEPFEEPYEQVCRNLFQSRNPYKHLKALGKIEFKTTGNLRGQTFDNTVVLVDEIQNMDFDELSTVMERVGVNSRIIFAGDKGQIDLNRKHKQKSGFDEFMSTVNKMDGHYAESMSYELDDIVRSGIVKEWLLAKYSK